MGKNLHIMQDNKFYAEMIQEINNRKLTESNRFAVKLYKNNKEVVIMPDYPNREIIPKNYDLQTLSKGFDKIIFHNIGKEDINQLAKFEKGNVKIIWRQWTTDTVNILTNAHLFKKFKFSSKKFKPYGNNSLKNVGLYFFNSILFWAYWVRSIARYYTIKKALQKIDIVGNWNVFETDEIKSFYPTFNAKFHYLNYGRMDSRQHQPESIEILSNQVPNKILVGHFGYAIVNYEELILFFGKHKEELNFDIYFILSYGDSGYIKKIIEMGRKVLGDKFYPVTDFMNKEEYFKFLSSFDVLIFNSTKQFGASNIHYALRSGKKIFLREENPMTNYFLKKNIKLFSTNKLLNNITYLNAEFSKKEALLNQTNLTNGDYEEIFNASMEVFIH